MHPRLTDITRLFRPSPLMKITDPLLAKHEVELWLKRDDLLHPIISGNKWRKLKYSLEFVLSHRLNHVVSMGGRYSNHLHALAYCAKWLGLKTTAYIRGEKPSVLTPTLEDIMQWGMCLRFVSRSDYRRLRHIREWDKGPDGGLGDFWLPEGGAQVWALQGVGEISAEITRSFDVWCVPCGTGTTLAGLAKAAPSAVSMLGFATFPHSASLDKEIQFLLEGSVFTGMINRDYHFGGFACCPPELLAFIDAFTAKTGIPLEPVYTGKMLFGLYDLIQKGYFKRGWRIMALHTGGLQGNRGYSRPII
jgi:1-aminocyclopropane-1-carboxylate deaminase